MVTNHLRLMMPQSPTCVAGDFFIIKVLLLLTYLPIDMHDEYPFIL